MQATHREQSMTAFQRSLAVSLGIHALICGTALAFAHYGEALLAGGSRVITVELIGGGSRQSSGPVRIARTAPSADRIVPAMPDLDEKQDALTDTGAQQNMSSLSGPAVDSGQESSGTGVSSESFPGGDAGIGSEGSGGPDGALSSEQWQLIQAALDKAKTYPRLARERGIEGTVLVRFRVLPSGEIDGVNVVKSSGAEVLDEASVRTVYRAVPMPYVKGWVEVPLVYELK